MINTDECVFLSSLNSFLLRFDVLIDHSPPRIRNYLGLYHCLQPHQHEEAIHEISHAGMKGPFFSMAFVLVSRNSV